MSLSRERGSNDKQLRAAQQLKQDFQRDSTDPGIQMEQSDRQSENAFPSIR
jgi:hypothetical protein